MIYLFYVFTSISFLCILFSNSFFFLHGHVHTQLRIFHILNPWRLVVRKVRREVVCKHCLPRFVVKLQLKKYFLPKFEVFAHARRQNEREILQIQYLFITKLNLIEIFCPINDNRILKEKAFPNTDINKKLLRCNRLQKYD